MKTKKTFIIIFTLIVANSYSQTKTKPIVKPTKTDTIFCILNSYNCGDSDCSLDITTQNKKFKDVAFKFDTDNKGKIIINVELKDIIIIDESSNELLNPKYLNKKARLIFVKQKAYSVEAAENNANPNYFYCEIKNILILN